MHIANEAARAVAALFHFAAVSVENAVAKISVPLRRFDQQDLIAADAIMAVGKLAQFFRAERHALIYAIDDDKVIAQAVHFGELEFH